MASISMADFRPHFPSDDPDPTPGSQTFGAATDGATGQRRGLSPEDFGTALAKALPPPSGDPAGDARRLAEHRRLLRQTFVMAILLHMLESPGAPLSRRQRRMSHRLGA